MEVCIQIQKLSNGESLETIHLESLWHIYITGGFREQAR